MSLTRKILRASARQTAALDRLEAGKKLPKCSTVTLALAGNTGSGDRRRAKVEASQAASRK